MIKILIAEDHILSAELLSMYLTQALKSKDITIVLDGKDLLETIDRDKPDLLILDLNMPKIDGLKALRKIREKDKTIKIFILSAYSDKWIIREAKRSGADKYISKSHDTRDLINIIREAENTTKDGTFFL